MGIDEEIMHCECMVVVRDIGAADEMYDVFRCTRCGQIMSEFDWLHHVRPPSNGPRGFKG